MGHERERARREVDGEPTTAAAAAGRRSRVEASYPTLARKLGPTAGEPSIDDVATAAVERKGGGAPVDAGVASTVGAHLGHDFSAVRVHGDPLAREASAAMGAQAFAYGSDVFLGPGASGTDLGLMAHELTHVAQQGAAGRRGAQAKVEVGAADTPAEREADQVAAAVTGGATPAVSWSMTARRPPARCSSRRSSLSSAPRSPTPPMPSWGRCTPPSAARTSTCTSQRYSDRPASESEALLRRFAPAVGAARAGA
jgi:hypothetical protein